MPLQHDNYTVHICHIPVCILQNILYTTVHIEHYIIVPRIWKVLQTQ